MTTIIDYIKWMFSWLAIMAIILTIADFIEQNSAAISRAIRTLGTVVSIILALAAVSALTYGVLWLRNKIRKWNHKNRRREAEVSVLERDAALLAIANESGTYFAFQDGNGAYAIHAAHLQHTPTKLLTAGVGGGDDQTELLKWALFTGRKQAIHQSFIDNLQDAPSTIPSRVELSQLMSGRPSVNNLILGVTENNEIVTESLRNLTHVAIAGTSRWGKSIFTQMLLYQIATAKEATQLYLADLGGTTFPDFGLPYASTLAETEAMVCEVMAEAERRKGLYEATGRGIRSLDIYNEVTGDNLPWVVMVIDEALYLMEKSKTVKESLEIAVSWAAKYGISAIIISQDWKSNVVATSTRNNFSSRFQFMAEDKTQANILVKGCDAHLIENKGRCFARLPGQNRVTEIQTPFISEDQIIDIAPHIKHKAVTPALPTTATNDTAAAPDLTFVVADLEPDKPTPGEMAIIEAVAAVKMDCGKIVWSQVTAALNWTATGPNNQRIKAVLDKWSITY